MADEMHQDLLSGLHKTWFQNPEVKRRLLDESSKLVLPAPGELAVQPSQQCCIMNEPFLSTIISRMREAKTLKIPGVEKLDAELLNLWFYNIRNKDRKRNAGRVPNVDPEYKVPEEIQAQIHLDSKALKTLMSTLRKQLMSERVAKDS